ncbi:PTS transporter subunit EIIC [Streptococcus marmotae]|uniref:PTS transporter subunit EIIC n=1 Tax=Streptococcus marmotae TaxID=1825069 RepID=UPI000830F1ED|nr:PTS transporter subunit EIIC [Streptococcus marmotae]
MDYKKLSKSIITNVGGKENIISLVHCATRLRFELKDEAKANEKILSDIDGVKGIMKQNGQFQVIIGSDVVNVYNSIDELYHLNAEVEGQTNTSKVGILSALTSIFTPILPAITGSGMLKALLAAAIAFKWLTSDSQNYIILNTISDAVFYFLPLLIAYTSSRYFKTNTSISLTLAGVLLYPALVELMGAGQPISFFGIPITSFSYSSTAVPIILIVWFESYIERFFYNKIHETVKFFLAPLLTLIITGLVGLALLGPIGAFVGNIFATIISYFVQFARIPGLVLIGVFGPFIGMTGMHQSFTPITIGVFTEFGFDPLMFPAVLAANMAQCGAALAVAVRSKNIKTKSMAYSSGITALMGITEPALFGVSVRYKTPLYGSMIGGGIGALVAGLLSLKAFAFGSPGLASIAMFIGGENPLNIVYAFIVLAISIITSFIATWLLGDSYLEEQA